MGYSDLLLILFVGLIQGLNIFTLAILISFISLLLTSALAKSRFFYSVALYLLTYLSTSVILLVAFLGLFSLIPISYIRLLMIVVSVILVFSGLSILIYTYEPENRFLRIFARNILQRRIRVVASSERNFFPIVMGFLASIGSISCPCTLPLIPAVASYIVLSEIKSSYEILLLYSVSATIPSLVILLLISVSGLREKILDLIKLNIVRFRIFTALVLVVLGLILIVVV